MFLHTKTTLYRLFTLLLMASLYVLTGCGGGNQVEIVYKNFGEQINSTQNLTIELNHNVAEDNQLNRWDSIPYIQFEPPINGLFNWETPSRLTFAPFKELPPATTVSGTLSSRVMTQR